MSVYVDDGHGHCVAWAVDRNPLLGGAEANARLIACAPELLSALKDSYRSYTEGSEFDLDVRPLVEKMASIIAKAEGRAE